MSDVRAAAERLRSASQMWSTPSQYQVDVLAVCNAYIAEHPADDDDTGDPVGWTIEAIGNDGSVRCMSPQGHVRRYMFMPTPKALGVEVQE